MRTHPFRRSSPAVPSLTVNRREFVGVLAGGVAALAGCGGSTGPTDNPRLTARPGVPTGNASPGVSDLGLSAARDGLLMVPPGYDPATPVPLLVSLHGAGSSSEDLFNFLRPFGEANGFALLGVDSRGNTWDAITGDYGVDPAFIDQALVHVFTRVAIDPARVVLTGFSDGASYALGLGLVNGDLFSRLIAFSPGFIPHTSTVLEGDPDVYITHGTQDPVLPIDATSRTIVADLRDAGYTVTYVEFAGGHTITDAVASDAVDWMLA